MQQRFSPDGLKFGEAEKSNDEQAITGYQLIYWCYLNHLLQALQYHTCNDIS
jgi:hypothetical protein